MAQLEEESGDPNAGSQLVTKTIEKFAQDFSIYSPLFTLTLKQIESVYAKTKVKTKDRVKISLTEGYLSFKISGGGQMIINAAAVKDYKWEDLLREYNQEELVCGFDDTNMLNLIKSCKRDRNLVVSFKRDELLPDSKSCNIWVCMHWNNILMYFKLPLFLYPRHAGQDSDQRSVAQDLSFQGHEMQDTNTGLPFPGPADRLVAPDATAFQLDDNTLGFVQLEPKSASNFRLDAARGTSQMYEFGQPLVSEPSQNTNTNYWTATLFQEASRQARKSVKSNGPGLYLQSQMRPETSHLIELPRTPEDLVKYVAKFEVGRFGEYF